MEQVEEQVVIVTEVWTEVEVQLEVEVEEYVRVEAVVGKLQGTVLTPAGEGALRYDAQAGAEFVHIEADTQTEEEDQDIVIGVEVVFEHVEVDTQAEGGVQRVDSEVQVAVEHIEADA